MSLEPDPRVTDEVVRVAAAAATMAPAEPDEFVRAIVTAGLQAVEFAGRSNRERLERAEEVRVATAKASTIPGMITHRWQSAFYAEAILDANKRRKVR